MKMQKKILFTLIVLYASLSFLLAAAFAGPVDILRFEKGDTLEEIRAKIKHNGYNFKVDHN